MALMYDNEDSEVTIKEAGELIAEDVSVEVAATGYFTADVVVPAGKVYKLKGVRSRGTSGSFTIASISFQLLASGGGGGEFISEGSAELSQLLGGYQLEIPAGWTIRSKFYVTSHTTTGNVRQTLLYSEIDA